MTDGYSAIVPSRALIDSRMFDVAVSTLPARIAQVEVRTLMKVTRPWAVVACLVSTLTGCGSPDTTPKETAAQKVKPADEPITPLESLSFDQWTRKVAALSANQQVEAVTRKLVELNPGFDGKVTSAIDGGVVTGFQVEGRKLTAISRGRPCP